MLEVVLHTNGNTLIFNGYTHEEFVVLPSDRPGAGNRVVILTGAGAAFMEPITFDGFDFFSPQGYDKILTKLGLLKDDLDYHLRMVIIFLFFGYQEWFDYEAQVYYLYLQRP